jgi:hypothetical protein
VGQKAAIALEWSEQIELSPDPQKNKGRGRPKGTLSEGAKKIGINERRVFEVRQIRDASPSLYQDVKADRRSLNSALAEMSPLRDTRFREFGLGKSGAASQERDGSAQQETRELTQPAGGKVARGAQKPASKDAAAAVKVPPSPAAIEKALARIKAILGSWFYAEVKARNLIQKPEEIVQYAKLTDAQMREIGPLLKKGWTLVAAFREVVERLTPDDEIRAFILGRSKTARIGACSPSEISGMLWCGGRKKIGLSQRLKTLWRRICSATILVSWQPSQQSPALSSVSCHG